MHLTAVDSGNLRLISWTFLYTSWNTPGPQPPPPRTVSAASNGNPICGGPGRRRRGENNLILDRGVCEGAFYLHSAWLLSTVSSAHYEYSFKSGLRRTPCYRSGSWTHYSLWSRTKWNEAHEKAIRATGLPQLFCSLSSPPTPLKNLFPFFLRGTVPTTTVPLSCQ